MRTFADLLRAEGPVLGTWAQIASPEVVEILGWSGMRFAIVDCEHGSFGIETAAGLIRACDAVGMVPLVRVPGPGREAIQQALDAGAAAVVVPNVSSAAQAREAVAATRFAPAGTRGACPCVRSGRQFIRDWPAYSRRMDAETGAVLLVETRDGLADFPAIAATPGLMCVLVGPFDLSVSMGHGGDYLHPEVQAAVRSMVAEAQRNGVPVMVPVFAPDAAEARRQMEGWLAQGVRLFAVGTDKILLSDHVSRYVAALSP